MLHIEDIILVVLYIAFTDVVPLNSKTMCIVVQINRCIMMSLGQLFNQVGHSIRSISNYKHVCHGMCYIWFGVFDCLWAQKIQSKKQNSMLLWILNSPLSSRSFIFVHNSWSFNPRVVGHITSLIGVICF